MAIYESHVGTSVQSKVAVSRHFTSESPCQTIKPNTGRTIRPMAQAALTPTVARRNMASSFGSSERIRKASVISGRCSSSHSAMTISCGRICAHAVRVFISSSLGRSDQDGISRDLNVLENVACHRSLDHLIARCALDHFFNEPPKAWPKAMSLPVISFMVDESHQDEEGIHLSIFAGQEFPG